MGLEELKGNSSNWLSTWRPGREQNEDMVQDNFSLICNILFYEENRLG